MENKQFKVIIVEDVKLELKGTEEIFRHEIPEAEVIGTAMTEKEFWALILFWIRQNMKDLQEFLQILMMVKFLHGILQLCRKIQLLLMRQNLQ